MSSPFFIIASASRTRSKAVAVAVLAMALAPVGCATMMPRLTPDQEANLETVRSFVEASRRAYGLGRISILVGDHYAGVGSTYRPGQLTISPSVLGSQYRDAQVAHMMAYAIIPREETFDRPLTQGEWEKRQVKRSLDANAKAVEILHRVRGWPERTALDHVSAWLTAAHEREQAGRSVPTPGHLRPCLELADLWKRFPTYQAPDSVPRCWGPEVPK